MIRYKFMVEKSSRHNCVSVRSLKQGKEIERKMLPDLFLKCIALL